MGKNAHPSSIRRILVVLGSAMEDRKSLHTAARLAAALQAELQVLYIQDMSLIRFAELPFAAELISHSASERSIDPVLIQKELEVQAKQVSRELARLAEQQNVKWSFETVRGHVESEILAASEQADLLIVNRATGRTLVTKGQLGTTAAVFVTKSRRTVVLLEQQNYLDKPLVVLIENIESGLKALATAVRLTLGQHRKLRVLICVQSPQAFEQLKAELNIWLHGQDRQAEFSWLRRVDPQMLAHRLWQQGGGVLVLSADSPVLAQTSIALIMRQLKLPLVLVR